MSTNSSVKILIVGNSGCGKSAFVHRHVSGNFLEHCDPNDNLAAELDWYNVKLSLTTTNTKIKFDIKFNAAIIMFDTLDMKSYQALSDWYEYVLSLGINKIAICATKVDQKFRVVGTKIIKKTYNIDRPLIYISSKSCYNFDKPFEYLLDLESEFLVYQGEHFLKPVRR